jgi:hypothetical protein
MEEEEEVLLVVVRKILGDKQLWEGGKLKMVMMLTYYQLIMRLGVLL